uniref:C-type lectin domain-containing protein n=1 Tax=Falco tinnunculus TaxID=100819 RepID=A0A8C4TZG0_FALTI
MGVSPGWQGGTGLTAVIAPLKGTEGAGAPSPTMLPCLLLTLALLSSASARHPGKCPLGCPPHGDTVGTPLVPPRPLSGASPKVGLVVPGQDTQCPLESETRALHVPNTLGATSFRYIFVARHQAFDSAQQTCIQCYRGNLASIHSHHINTFLQRQARCHIAGTSQLWIGAITQRLVRDNPHPRWTDGSPWNYSQWKFGHPRCLVSRCTTLSSQGQWGEGHGGHPGPGGAVLGASARGCVGRAHGDLVG